jgi:Arc/MetJ-type ribon-helix-helix transcriptional regulator
MAGQSRTKRQAKANSDPYNPASELIRNALRLHETTSAARLDEFRSDIDRRLASLDREEGLDGEKVFACIRERSERRRNFKR